MNKKIVLASKSPRRKKLLEQINFEFDICPAEGEEIIDEKLAPAEICMSLAYQKANEVSKKYDDAVIIGSDTIVVFEKHILGKPKDKQDAERILNILSENTHSVFTGVSLINSGTGEEKRFYEETKVTFRKLKDSEIYEYINSGSPMDKAGAYGIQDDFGAVFVSKIEGCYYNVVGLPLSRLYEELSDF
jgi:septum formation protein